MRPRNVGAARATLTREDSKRSRKFEEPWQSRPWDWREVGQFSLQGHVRGLAKSLQRGKVEMLSGPFNSYRHLRQVESILMSRTMMTLGSHHQDCSSRIGK